MAARRQSEEDRRKEIADIVGDVLSKHQQAQDEEKDPNKKWMRTTIRQEIQAALEGLTGKSGGQQRKPQEQADEEEEESAGLFESLFGKQG